MTSLRKGSSTLSFCCLAFLTLVILSPSIASAYRDVYVKSMSCPSSFTPLHETCVGPNGGFSGVIIPIAVSCEPPVLVGNVFTQQCLLSGDGYVGPRGVNGLSTISADRDVVWGPDPFSDNNTYIANGSFSVNAGRDIRVDTRFYPLEANDGLPVPSSGSITLRAGGSITGTIGASQFPPFINWTVCADAPAVKLINLTPTRLTLVTGSSCELPKVSISATPSKIVEGGAAGTFTVTRTGNTGSPLTVSYQASGTAATNGTDYPTLPGTVVIPAGQSSATMTVSAIADGVPEGDEAVILSLQSNAAYTIGSPNSATVTINDNTTPAFPTPSNLACTSGWIYSGEPSLLPSGITLDTQVIEEPAVGGRLAVLRLSDGTRVIVIRGTSLEGAAGPNLAADTTWMSGFLDGTPTQALRNLVRWTAQNVALLIATSGGAPIYITGHSLGGAVAQMVGSSAGIPTITFNAPGSSQLIPNLSGELAAVGGPTTICGSCVLNYRMAFDPVSRIGTQVGDVFTILSPPKPNFDLYPWAHSLDRHSIDNLCSALNGGAPFVAGDDSGILMGPVISPVRRNINLTPLGNQKIQIDYSTAVQGGKATAFDPPGARSIEVTTADLSSSLFIGMVLPVFYPEFKFLVETWDGHKWVRDGIADGGIEYVLTAGPTSRFRVRGYDPMTQTTILIPSDFIFYLTFSSDGIANFSMEADLDYLTDNFYCSAASPVRGVPSFKPQQVTIIDRFGEKLTDVTETVGFCSPASTNDEGVLDANTHLAVYKIVDSHRESRHNTSQSSRHTVVNQFGTLDIYVKKMDRLMVPSRMSVSEFPNFPPLTDHVDSYTCYAITAAERFPKNEVEVEDQFGKLTVEIKKPNALCVPAKINDKAIKQLTNNLVCYETARIAKPGKPKRVKDRIRLTNLFGNEALRLTSLDDFCVPSVIDSP